MAEHGYTPPSGQDNHADHPFFIGVQVFFHRVSFAKSISFIG